MSETTQTLAQFLKGAELHLHVHRIDQRPDHHREDNPHHGMWEADARHWLCVLTRGDKRDKRYANDPDNYRPPANPCPTMTLYFSQGSAHTKAPTLADIIDCLASDASSFDNADSFEDWASDMGWDEDSRKAERCYRAVEKQRGELAELLTADQFDALLWHTERE